jgi:hypothetical protein
MDKMLTELYRRVFQTVSDVERLNSESGETNDRLRQVAIAKNAMLNELIGIRTQQIRDGEL